MSKTLSARTSRTPGSRRQAYLLIALGVMFLIGAWLFHPAPSTYPIGLLLFGAGMLVAALLNPYRLLVGGLLVTLVGLSIFFSFKPVIPDGGSTLLLAIGLGLLAVALAARRGYIGRGAITPAVIVLVIGLVEYPPSARFLPANFATFLLSLWFPGFGLLLLGILSLFSGGKDSVGSTARQSAPGKDAA